MDKEIIQRWENGKENLRTYFFAHRQEEYDSYKKIVSVLISECLNYGINDKREKISPSFEVSDYGEYQGTQIFLLHKDDYQPDAGKYYIFDNYYDSCSGCDTLLSISMYDSGIPTESQVEEYMALCLHMVQRMRCLKDLWED